MKLESRTGLRVSEAEGIATGYHYLKKSGKKRKQRISKTVNTITKLAPLIFNLAIAGQGIAIATEVL